MNYTTPTTTHLLHAPPLAVRLLNNPQALLATVVLAVFASLIFSWATADRSIPRITSSKSWYASRDDFRSHGVEIIAKGYNSVQSGVFKVTGLDGSDLVLISPKNWLAICKKKDDEVQPALKEFFLCQLHGAPFEEPYLYQYLPSRMPGFERHLDVISKALDEGISDVFDNGFDYSTGAYQGFIMQPQILHIYSHVIWRVILGDSFSSEVVAIFERYSAILIPVMKKLKAQRPMMARVTAAFSKEVRQVNEQLQKATDLFRPMMERCHEAMEQGLPSSASRNEWYEELVRNAPEGRRRDYKYLTNILIGFAFTFVFSPAPSTTHIVYEFAFRPGFIPEVLDEARGVMGQRPENWTFTREGLRKLSLLDSFCKETHKHHPTAASNLMRKIHKTQTLPNGIVLKAGTTCEVVMTAAHLANPGFENAAEWNGRRYHELRQQMAASGSTIGASKYDWGQATRDDVNFGYASHMCPGRWSGCSIAKMFLLKLLAGYHVRPEDGATERYPDVHSGQYILPNPRPILVRPRQRL
ncbi:Cytochrome P450 monooxygenase ATR2 [Colletotrichum sidae]|uniref:Cytochrome P450 monooxygenase ATR2 n=1 Tax=Colletotrichum sidae TaxID=1347389 RepID=A0A4R8TJU6_9PEZI|nr:Cytochrome P450 monooxygenase ATR2 [Colletotrichum sidae]